MLTSKNFLRTVSQVGAPKMNEQTLRQFQEISALLNSSLDHGEIRQRAIESATIIMDAEAGSLLLLDEATGELYFDVAHGEKSVAVRQVRLGFGQGIAGHVARTGEPLIVNDVQGDSRFSRRADQASGFVTRNMVCVPVRARGRFLGVLQAINRKHDGLFEDNDLQNFVALGHQVGVAIENANLYEEIHKLFEGFISASVQAIESRDPTTSGHSQRVASLTCRLAEIVNLVETGPYARILFNAEQIKEIRYAAVLHDFGKVGVREHILSKAEKLYPAQQEAVKARFDFIKRTLEADTLRRKLEIYETNRHESTQTLFAQLDQQLERQIHDVDDMFSFVLKCNQPMSLSHHDCTSAPSPAGTAEGDRRSGIPILRRHAALFNETGSPVALDRRGKSDRRRATTNPAARLPYVRISVENSLDEVAQECALHRLESPRKIGRERLPTRPEEGSHSDPGTDDDHL